MECDDSPVSGKKEINFCVKCTGTMLINSSLTHLNVTAVFSRCVQPALISIEKYKKILSTAPILFKYCCCYFLFGFKVYTVPFCHTKYSYRRFTFCCKSP